MFNHQSVSKGIASLNLVEKLNIKSAEILSIGNNNDISMLKFAALGIDIAHAIADVKVYAYEIYDVS